jgi:hypothetical protein
VVVKMALLSLVISFLFDKLKREVESMFAFTVVHAEASDRSSVHHQIVGTQ